MKYIGIDLGTTNSVISNYENGETKVWSETEEYLTTPSAIYIIKEKDNVVSYYGRNAYNYSFVDPDNSAKLFKRFLGTEEKIYFKSIDEYKTPIECSGEIIKYLLSFLPETWKREEMGLVITVPAAFNQMKKNATLEAAKLAGINSVVLLQEPVAAIMSIMKNADQKGNFIVYDLGGGTFDVSVATNINGSISLLSNGGVEMCGGRDIDRMIFNNSVLPFINENFNINLSSESEFRRNKKYRNLYFLIMKEIEKSKTELDKKEKMKLQIDASIINIVDKDGKEVYIDLTLSRDEINEYLEDIIDITVDTTKEMVEKAGLSLCDINNIVFIGGPTNYGPLREKVCEELGIKENVRVNPMTTVAEGASVFAESINWDEEELSVKKGKFVKDTKIGLKFKYESRTSQNKARVMCILEENLKNYEIEFTSTNTGWQSGKLSLKDKLLILLPIDIEGENTFKVEVRNGQGALVEIDDNIISIVKTISIGSVVASNSIGIAAKDKTGNKSELVYMVLAGDKLPCEGDLTFTTDKKVVSGSSDYIDFQIWEGDNQKNVTDNFPVGTLKITGLEFDESYIPKGAELLCHYKISMGGDISLNVSIPSIEQNFKKDNFYCAQNIDTNDLDKVREIAVSLIHRANYYKMEIYDSRLSNIEYMSKEILDVIDAFPSSEDVLACYDKIKLIQKILYKVQIEHQEEFRQMKLNGNTHFFNSKFRDYANEETINQFEELTRRAQNAIDRNTGDFDAIMKQLYYINGSVFYYNDKFMIEEFDKYKNMSPSRFTSQKMYKYYIKEGEKYLENKDYPPLRDINLKLKGLLIGTYVEEEEFGSYDVNIVKI